MLNLILTSLSHLLSRPMAVPASNPWIYEDSSWHSSSFELARGLEVIEYSGRPPAVFADTLPAFQSCGA